VHPRPARPGLSSSSSSRNSLAARGRRNGAPHHRRPRRAARAPRRLLVVLAAAAAEGDWALDGPEPRWEAPEEDWVLGQLAPLAQHALLDATVFFQGSALRLRDLEGAWPSLREEADGALLSALARGAAAMGAAPPAPGDAHAFVPRTLEHAAELDPAVLWRLDPAHDHVALSGASRRLLSQLKAGAPLADDDDDDSSDEDWEDGVDPNALFKENDRWTVLSRWGEGEAEEGDEPLFRVATGGTYAFRFGAHGPFRLVPVRSGLVHMR
ncbi:Protein of unknown function, partial [Gryllus bimaculatus]